MLFAACSLSLVLQFEFRAEDGHARRGSPAELSRPGTPGEQGIALRLAQFSVRKTSEAFVPPKPNELDKAA